MKLIKILKPVKKEMIIIFKVWSQSMNALSIGLLLRNTIAQSFGDMDVIVTDPPYDDAIGSAS